MINNTKESWENTITLISSLLGDSYIVKELYIRDYGSAEIIYSNREWTPDDGKLLILSISVTLTPNLFLRVSLIHASRLTFK